MCPKKIVLFDVDGTLTPARGLIDDEMKDIISQLRSLPDVDVGVVGGSDAAKQLEQLGQNCREHFDYNFSENGVVGYKNGEKIHSNSIVQVLGDDNLQELINFVLHRFAQVTLPKKRGTFIEFRTGMLNISPCGRAVSRAERNEFYEYDMEHNIREAIVGELRERFGERFGLTFSIGGQISIDVFPNGWDKTYCLQFVKEHYEEIHFFGDKVYKGGNDHEIYTHPDVIGHAVETPADTKRILREMFLSE
ncbi:hypothetical protein PCE1_000069 [Barthelona sp. PCE]